MPSEAAVIKKFHSNKIKFAIEKKAFENEEIGLKEELVEQMREFMGLTKGSKKLYMFMNNTVQPSVQELAIIAQVLGINDMWELIKLEE